MQRRRSSACLAAQPRTMSDVAPPIARCDQRERSVSTPGRAASRRGSLRRSGERPVDRVVHHSRRPSATRQRQAARAGATESARRSAWRISALRRLSRRKAAEPRVALRRARRADHLRHGRRGHSRSYRSPNEHMAASKSRRASTCRSDSFPAHWNEALAGSASPSSTPVRR